MKWLTKEMFNPLDLIFIMWTGSDFVDGNYIACGISFLLFVAWAIYCGKLKGGQS